MVFGQNLGFQQVVISNADILPDMSCEHFADNAFIKGIELFYILLLSEIHYDLIDYMLDSCGAP